MNTPTIDQVNRRWFQLCRVLGITPNLDERGEPRLHPEPHEHTRGTETFGDAALTHARGNAAWP